VPSIKVIIEVIDMNLSVTLKTRKREIQFSLKSWHLALTSVGFVLLVGSLISSQLTRLEPIRKELAEQRIENEMQVAQLDEMRQSLSVQLQQLAGRVGLLQAHTQRLEALGSRLTQTYQLDPAEFDFNAEPPVGGPIVESETEQQAPGELLEELLTNIDLLGYQLNDRSRQLIILENLLLNHQIHDESFVSGHPITDGWLSSYYGIRTDPFTRKPTKHRGIDFAGKEGGEVIATGAGVVTWASNSGGYGGLVEIDHGGGLATRYAHNKSIEVEVGDVVAKGQLIARMGSTGRSTGPHVHYEVLKHGKQIDPTKYVYRKAK
jgi:murein DD-endopeptidase MepM/ murein hydrolase activator NlpD